ncbi:hypothetical protein BU17DRAFT_62145 [Hysterangium stoloniferum]|nr:hypothetical protein BU17DRAFT_62145 [Hysterangium stoloniferum]
MIKPVQMTEAGSLQFPADRAFGKSDLASPLIRPGKEKEKEMQEMQQDKMVQPGTTDPPCGIASTYRLDQLARKQHWVCDFSTRFADIDIVADFERTSVGLARLGEWESGTTLSDVETINNATSVRRERTLNLDGKEMKSKWKTPRLISEVTRQ